MSPPIIVRRSDQRFLAERFGEHAPLLVQNASQDTRKRILEFFIAQIRNQNTRKAYWNATCRMMDWIALKGIIELAEIAPTHVAAYIEQLTTDIAAPSVKLHLAAIRKLFDYLVTGGHLKLNPAAPVKGPKHSVTEGKTPVLTAEEARDLFSAIPTDTASGLRDRALIATMLFSLARIGAVTKMKVEDYYYEGRRNRLRFQEKGGKYHAITAHHLIVEND